MIKYIAILSVVVLAACSTTQRVKPVVVQSIEQQRVALPEVPAPAKPNYPVFQFQKPDAVNNIVGMDEENYNKLRQMLLQVNKRDLEWYNRLYQANGTIRLLQE